ncbi:DUF1045 domain-containing protein [Roseivivax sp.]
MTSSGWQRYAVYWLPDGQLGELGASWLGWDARHARRIDPPQIKAPGPKRYGFHATLKPPFHLAPDEDEVALLARLESLAGAAETVDLGTLELRQLGRIWTLQPSRTEGISDLAATLVRGLDPFRALPAAEELARRRGRGLSPAQEANLTTWGYPYVMEEFRPHLTLSGARGPEGIETRAKAHFAPVLGAPATMGAVTLLGEDGLGRFHRIADLALNRARVAT